MRRNVNLYPAFRKALLDYLSKNPVMTMSRTEAAALFNVSALSATNYMKMLATQFKDNLRYDRGLLIVVRLPTQEQIEQVLASENVIPYPENLPELPKRKRAKGKR
jgi:hypothetical protein